MKLGTNLTNICKKQGRTIAQLARDAGLPIQTLHGWTTGRSSVKLDQLKRVANVLKISLHELAFGEPDPHEPAGEEILKEIFAGDVRVTLHRIERKRKK
jgi:transcriptional regulator with XRE-family HTH domain